MVSCVLPRVYRCSPCPLCAGQSGAPEKRALPIANVVRAPSEAGGIVIVSSAFSTVRPYPRLTSLRSQISPALRSRATPRSHSSSSTLTRARITAIPRRHAAARPADRERRVHARRGRDYRRRESLVVGRQTAPVSDLRSQIRPGTARRPHSRTSPRINTHAPGRPFVRNAEVLAVSRPRAAFPRRLVCARHPRRHLLDDVRKPIAQVRTLLFCWPIADGWVLPAEREWPRLPR